VTALVDDRSFSGVFCQSRAHGSTAESDEVLMRRYQRGDEQAFRQLYERHRASLLRFARRLSAEIGDSEEIAQETWMAVIQGRERYRPQARFVTYLFSIARRRTMDRWRKLGRAPPLEPDAEELDRQTAPTTHEPEFHAATVALRADLMTAVESLPIMQREAFLLRAEGSLTLEEIGAVTGTSRETAKSRLRYALNRLRIMLEPWHDE
jgi:RNA polymerase sigma-70 factor, ECF subfamily